jgi:exonuclease III
MKKILLLTVLIFRCFSYCISQQNIPLSKSTQTIAFWNVDKLYDIINDPVDNDEDFLPAGPKQWNDEKYKKKITDIAKVIASINEKELPSIIGLAEVENQKVLEDLVASPKLRKAKYGNVLYDGKDPDGLNVAMLFKKDEVEIIDSKLIPVVSTFELKDVIKDILYVKCKIKADNIYHIFINHWPSRSFGDQDELKRISAAISLRREVDNVLNLDNRARIIIMGDFNDEPTNKSLMQMMNAINKRKNLNYRDLYNMMYDSHNMTDEGSFFENGKFLMFDQIIVSPEILNKASGSYLEFGEGKIFIGENISKTDTLPNIKAPVPTYSGDMYIGGASSHFPVFVILKKEEK